MGSAGLWRWRGRNWCGGVADQRRGARAQAGGSYGSAHGREHGPVQGGGGQMAHRQQTRAAPPPRLPFSQTLARVIWDEGERCWGLIWDEGVGV